MSRHVVDVMGEHGPIEHEHAILGACHGFLLCRRSENDPHVCILPVTHDDGNWFVSRSESGFSSFWLSQYTLLIEAVNHWLEEHCFMDEWGWYFRD